MLLKLFVFSFLLSEALCQSYNYADSYQLPDENETKSLNVTIAGSLYTPFQVTIECYNYDSLKYFEIRSGEHKGFELRYGILLEFIKCFNNETDNENYNYRLSRWFNSLPYFKTEYYNGYTLTIKLNEYAEVNSDVLFENFDFKKFSGVTFINLGFASSKFLANLHCQNCVFQNNGRIDFNYFDENISDKNWLQMEINSNKLINFNPDNLKKLQGLTSLEIINFDLDDSNAFNVPNLFEHNTNVTQIRLENSTSNITLHGQVLVGLISLQNIRLIGLQLDHISKDLFKDLGNLTGVHLSSNNIQTMDPATFQETKLISYIVFSDNPFFTEPHDKFEAFYVGNQMVTFNGGNFTEHTFDLLEQLIRNPKVSSVTFQSFLIDKFNFEDFTKIIVQRDSRIDIIFESGEPAFDLEHIKSHENIIRSIDDINPNVIIRFEFAGYAICNDCTLLKRIFPHYLKGYHRSRPGFYFEEIGLFVEFKMPDSCNLLHQRYEEIVTENCPANCVCKFNPLLDKFKIDCNNKNLSEIPHILYPAQFDKLHSIDLNFENNSISVLSLASQGENVLKKLSTLNVQYNNIKTIEINEAHLANIWVLHLSGNPIIENDYIQLNLAAGLRYYNKYGSNVQDEEYPPLEYIQEHNQDKLLGYLNGMQKCNK